MVWEYAGQAPWVYCAAEKILLITCLNSKAVRLLVLQSGRAGKVGVMGRGGGGGGKEEGEGRKKKLKKDRGSRESKEGKGERTQGMHFKVSPAI